MITVKQLSHPLDPLGHAHTPDTIAFGKHVKKIDLLSEWLNGGGWRITPPTRAARLTNECDKLSTLNNVSLTLLSVRYR